MAISEKPRLIGSIREVRGALPLGKTQPMEENDDNSAALINAPFDY